MREEGKEVERETESKMETEGVGSRLAACEGDNVEIKISIRACGWSDYNVLGSCQC